MKKTTITNIILMYITILLYALPLNNIYNSIKNPNIPNILINTLYITTLTTNLILSTQKTSNNKLTISNTLLSITLALTIIPLGLKPKTPDLTEKIITYSFPTLYMLITTTYTITNNTNFKKWVKKEVNQSSSTLSSQTNS